MRVFGAFVCHHDHKRMAGLKNHTTKFVKVFLHIVFLHVVLSEGLQKAPSQSVANIMLSGTLVEKRWNASVPPHKMISLRQKYADAGAHIQHWNQRTICRYRGCLLRSFHRFLWPKESGRAHLREPQRHLLPMYPIHHR